jgi:hypothetical protein
VKGDSGGEQASGSEQGQADGATGGREWS